MIRSRIIPFYVPPLPCEPMCLYCHPLAGMAPELWPSMPTVQRVLERIGTEHELLQLGTLSSANGLELAWYGGLLSQPDGVRRPLLEASLQGLSRGLLSRIRLALRPDQVETSAPSELKLLDLQALGVSTFELEVASVVPSSLQRMGPGHHPRRLEQAIPNLRQLQPGVQVGLTVRIGMPGSYAEAELRGAEWIASLQPDFVRLHPVLVLANTWLEQEMLKGRFHPLTLDEAVSLCRHWMEPLESKGIPVIRVGIQPIRDLHLRPGVVVGGPFHPSLRTLMDAETLLERAGSLLQGRILTGQKIVLGVAPGSEGALRAPENHNLNRLKRRFRCASLQVQVDPTLARGDVVLLAP